MAIPVAGEDLRRGWTKDERLLRFLTMLGRDVDIVVRQPTTKDAQVRVTRH
jgi:hypothetical protein